MGIAAIIGLVIQIFINLPEIIATIKKLWELIKALRGEQKLAYEHRLGGVLVRCLKNRRMAPEDHAEISKMYEELRAK